MTISFGSASGPGVSTDYDAFGRAMHTTTTMGGVAGTLHYAHDAAGRRTSLTHPGGASIGYGYDAAGRLTSLSETGGAVLANFHYDNFGRPLARGYAVAYTNIGYDSASRVESLLHDLGGTSADQLIGLAYNPVGQITARSMTNEAYVSNSAYPVSRGYSVNGLNQYTAAGPANLQYDGNGNMRSDGTTNFVYDAENRLVSANGVQNATLAYDPLGRLYQAAVREFS